MLKRKDVLKPLSSPLGEAWRGLLVFLFIASLLAGCGTSRTLSRHSRHPDAAHQQLGYDYGDAANASAQSRSESGKHKQKQSAVSPLVAELQGILDDSVLQFSQIALSIVDLTDGHVIFEHRAHQRMRPASTQKMITAITALDHLGPNYCFATRLLTTAQLEPSGTLRGDIYLRGGMDPLLSAADVRRLATALREAGVRQVRGRIITDASMKDGDQFGWGWCWDDDNPTLSPLLVGGKPALAVAFQNALRGAGVKVTNPAVANGTTPATARELAAIRRPLTEVLQPMMKESDNLCAESMFYQLGPTRDKAAATVMTTLTNAYVQSNTVLGAVTSQPSQSPRIVIADGSGLSLYNYHTAASFTNLLTYAATRPDSILNPLLAALPIAAVDGTLRKRMTNTSAANNVRAKTGSVTAVSTLVGYTTQRSTGRLIAFAILNNGVENMAQGRDLQDRICIALSR